MIAKARREPLYKSSLRKQPAALSPVSRPGRSKADAGFDRLVYERVRLVILSALAVQHELSFSDLKESTAVSDGNLSAHLRKLEEAGYLRCEKSFADRRPRSTYRLTAPGRAALDRFLDHVEAVIKVTTRR
jgi:DNA-binding MarR family transcriptional regulator